MIDCARSLFSLFSFFLSDVALLVNFIPDRILSIRF